MKYEIGYKTPRGQYKSVVRDFKNESHRENYELLLERNGNKIIGRFKLYEL
jgi:hypothetical protein